MKRKYELRKRAERQAETRDRIVRATVGLHTSVGPAATTISAIAKAAGVQRHTVYAHFPDEDTLFRACTSHWRAEHPFPDIAGAPLGEALEAVYAWYESVAHEFALFLRDAHAIPELAREREDAFAALADGLVRPYGRSRAGTGRRRPRSRFRHVAFSRAARGPDEPAGSRGDGRVRRGRRYWCQSAADHQS